MENISFWYWSKDNWKTEVMKRSSEPVLDVSKEIGLKLSTLTDKYIFVSRHEKETNRVAPVSVGGAQKFQIIHPHSVLLPRALSSWFPRNSAFPIEIWIWSILYFPGRPKKSWRLTSRETKAIFALLTRTFARPTYRLQQRFISSNGVALPMVTWTILMSSVFWGYVRNTLS
jgi:hypothetical protein